VCDALAGRLSRVRTGCEAVRIDPDRREVVFGDGSCESFETLVSTVPLPELGARLTRVPAQVRAAFKSLKYLSVTNINIGLRYRPAIGNHWVYFPQKEMVFYRLVFPGNFFPSGVPRGCFSVSCEISHLPRGSSRNRDIARSLKDLRRLGWSLRSKDIAVAQAHEIPYAYCIYDRCRGPALKTIFSFLKRRGIHSIGRYGGWRYASMEDVMEEGRRVASQISPR
jgi:protoporphyrinogen oxidase